METPDNAVVMNMNSNITPDNPLDNAELMKAKKLCFSVLCLGIGFQLSSHILKKANKYDNYVFLLSMIILEITAYYQSHFFDDF